MGILRLILISIKQIKVQLMALTEWQRENFVAIEKMVKREPLTFVEISFGLNIGIESLRSWKKRGWLDTIKEDRLCRCHNRFGQKIIANRKMVHIVAINWPAND